jgi:hypothetical protein
MMDTEFLAELRDWAEQAHVAFEGRAETAWSNNDPEAAEVASLAARTFADLRTLTSRQLAVEHDRMLEERERATR